MTHAHGHPKLKGSNIVNVPGVSTDKDIPTAQANGFPIYAIDAYKGKVGDEMKIHRANPNGKKTKDRSTKNVGKTGGSFNIGRDALEINGKKRIK